MNSCSDSRFRAYSGWMTFSAMRLANPNGPELLRLVDGRHAALGDLADELELAGVLEGGDVDGHGSPVLGRVSERHAALARRFDRRGRTAPRPEPVGPVNFGA